MTVTTRISIQGTDATSFVITLPNGSNVSGRRVVVVASKDGTGTITWPSSPAFTEIVAGNGTQTHIAVAYRDIDGTEGFTGTDDTITVTGASEQWNAHAYLLTSDEFDSAQAPEGAATVIGTNNGTTDPPSLTPSWGSANNLWIAASALRFAGNWTAAPTNYTDLLSSNGGDNNAPLGTARRVLTATVDDPGTFSHDGGNTAWVATTLAVRPAGGGGATATPAVIAATAALPQTAVSVAAAPTSVSAVSALPPPVVSVGVTPAATQTVVALPQATPDTGGGNATATPAAIAATSTLPQAAVSAAAVPAVIPALATLPQVAVSIGAAPTALSLIAALPQAVPDTGSGNATALPAAITALTATPQATVSAGAAPATIESLAALPQAGVGIIEPAANIAVTTVMPLAVPQVGAGPPAIAASATVPDVDVSVGAAPGTITVVTTLPLVEFVGDVAADINPVTATVRDTGHMATVEDGGHTATVRDSGHTATVREMR